MNGMQTVSLLPGASMIEVARRFHASEASVYRATYSKGRRGGASSHWKIQFTGPSPDLYGLAL